jgi:hypothetical protein
MKNENELRVKEKVEFFFDEKIKVHVELVDKTFLNGFIVSRLRDEVYWMEENKLGGIYLFLKDIYDIDKFKER